jgi:O-acetyl-ADP-ribose deacetylase (regulator of RNase III)
MISFTKGDLLRDEAEALVNTVNCVGVMGRGIALQFRNAFPENNKAYERACEAGGVQPGRMFVFETGQLTHPRYIINFPTKRHWRGKSRMADIEAGLDALVAEIRRRGISSIAVPPLGSGLGGLHWPEVRELIHRKLESLPAVTVRVYEPGGAPAAGERVKNREVPKMTPGRAGLVELVRRYLDGLLDPFVTLLEVHKLMYFLQEAGEPLRLRYNKAPYGPFAENLSHVLKTVEGHLLSGYADGGDAPDKRLVLVPGAVHEAEAFLSEHQETKERLARVSKLVEGFESSYGMELLATVHWVMTQEGADDEASAVKQVHGWNERKRRFTPRQIEVARRSILESGILARLENHLRWALRASVSGVVPGNDDCHF